MMSVMLSEGVIVSSPPVEPTPPPAGFSLYPALFSVTCRQAASLLPHKLPCRKNLHPGRLFCISDAFLCTCM